MGVRFFFLLAAALMCNSLHAQQVETSLDASTFLSGPPADTSVEYLKDYTQYLWGKSVRNASGWEYAAADINFQLTTYTKAFTPYVGLQISKDNTPSIYRALEYVLTSGKKAIENIKTGFGSSMPPYARFNEQSLVPSMEKEYSTISSYPSSFAFMGWLTALTLVEICPDKQDDILLRGYNFGMSSVIAGYNWDSDIVSGRIMACAQTVMLHSQSVFKNMMTASKDWNHEYYQVSGFGCIIFSKRESASCDTISARTAITRIGIVFV